MEADEYQAPGMRTARPIVAAFAEALEAKLRVNDHVKPEWYGERTQYLLSLLRLEVRELAEELASAEYWGRSAPDAVLSECCDIAAFAMMIADVCGALPPTEDRGRRYAERAREEGGAQ